MELSQEEDFKKLFELIKKEGTKAIQFPGPRPKQIHLSEGQIRAIRSRDDR